MSGRADRLLTGLWWLLAAVLLTGCVVQGRAFLGLMALWCGLVALHRSRAGRSSAGPAQRRPFE